MNLSFDNTQNAFAYKSTPDLKKAKFLISVIQNPIMVSLATKVTPLLMKMGFPINGILRNFDGFENFLYKSNNNLAYPKVLYVHPITGLGTLILRDTTHASVTAWYNALIDEGANYDKYNPNYLVNNIPDSRGINAYTRDKYFSKLLCQSGYVKL